MDNKVKLWDAPVRIVHWSFVGLVPALWLSAENGRIDLHQTLGLVLLGLVAFRILWGFFGSDTARFARFVKGPGAVIAYLKGVRSGEEAAPSVGHNAAGGWSVIALLGLLAAQVTIGLFTQDVDGIESGPLSYLVSYETADAMREWHELVFNAIVGLVVLHVAAIMFYRFVKKDNLIHPMVTGSKRFATAVTAPAMAPLWKALPLVLIAGGMAWWISIGAPLGGQ